MNGEPGTWPFEALSDAVGRVDRDGVVHPLNGSMRELLAGLGATHLDELTLAADGTGGFRIVGDGDERWLVVPASSRLGSELAAARLRVLGGLAGAIVHDLSNLLLAGIGVAEALRPHVRDAADLQALSELERGATQGASIGRALALLIRSGPRDWRRVKVAAIVADLVAIVHKHAAQRGVGVAVGECVADVEVRIPVPEITQALLHGALFFVEQRARRVELRVADDFAGLAGGRRRRVALVELMGDPIASGAQAAAEAVLLGEVDVLRATLRSGGDRSGLLAARIALARVGGAIAVRGVDDRLSLEFVLPACAAP
ncbi:MAG: hypothetical protein KDE27_26785 [Planctomycetes bacterium]|nr:hypothetical protein [Planctomycetota bacterium]